MGTVAAVLLFVAATPALAAGEWLAGGGQLEPSTGYDTDRYMFQGTNPTAVDKVYFNGYFMSMHGTNILATDTNLDGGHIMSPSGNIAVAWLGFWRDCNEDGYIGLKGAPSYYGSSEAYSVALAAALGTPVNTAICPAGGNNWLTNPSTGQPNAFVDEFRWIGPGAGCDPYEAGCPGNPTSQPAELCVVPSRNPEIICVEGLPPGVTNGINDVTDNASRMWADWERPGGPHVPYGPLAPLPRGTFADSDGTLQFVDDATVGTLSSTLPGWNSKPNVGACDQPNPTFLGGSGTCGAWPLYQVRRLVNDTSCASADSPEGQQDPGCWEPDPLVTTWDIENDDDGDGNPCNDGADQAVTDPRNNENLVRVSLPDPAIGPGSVNPNVLADGSIAGTLEHQERALNGTDTGANSADSQCAPNGEDEMTDTFCGVGVIGCGFLETESSPSQVKHAEPSMILNLSTEQRYHYLQQFGFYDMPVDGGHTLGGPNGINDVYGWRGNTVWTGRPPRAGWGYTTAPWATFYADVTTESVSTVAAAGALPAGAQDAHTYGTEFCDAFTTGPANVNPANDWECSTTVWESVRASYPETRGEHYTAIIGEKYDLRDVDCYDNTVSDHVAGGALAGLRAGIAQCTDF